MKKKFGLICAALAVCMSMALTGCGVKLSTEHAVKNTEGVVFTATPSEKYIQVEMENGAIQKLDSLLDKDLYAPEKLKVADYNFDGYADIAFPYDYNDHNIAYQLWLYNPETEAFEECGEFSGLYNPELDADQKQIRVTAYNDPQSTTKSVYDWREGKIFCLEVESIIEDAEGKKTSTKFVYNEETKQMEMLPGEEK